MHNARPSHAAPKRRVLACAGLIAMGAGAVMLGAAPRSAAATHAPTHAARTTHCSSVTRHGPQMYDPTTHGHFSKQGAVKVSQACGLVNQLVDVSWTNFTPSVPNGSPGPYYTNTQTFYGVMVTECRGIAPASMDSCYLADNHGLPLAFGSAGIPNTQYAITSTAGTGQAHIDIETGLENSFLGCDQKHPCSLVVVPGQGGAPGKCADHSSDVGQFGAGNALASNTFSLTVGTSGQCSWNDRIVIPLHFAPTPTGCPRHNVAFSAAGSPMMFDAMQQWLTGLCAGRHGMTINYDSTLGEPTAVTNAANKIDDVALTTLPASADGVSTGNRPFVYAPIAVSAVSVAYSIDNTSTGEQLSGLDLNQRLMAKLLTTSYSPANECGFPPAPGCDPGVEHNPFSLFFDPEFAHVDPAIAAAVQPVVSAQPYLVPTVMSGPSDMTWTVTRWIGADSGASSFLAGTFDPYGMHVNTSYLGLKYPANTFQVQDPSLLWSNEYQPVFGLAKAVAYQAVNEDSGSNISVTNPNGTVSYTKDPPEPVGHRALMAVIDQGDAALDHLPTAAIRNPAGKYVRPSNAGMAAALSHMISDGSGTQQVNLTNKDPNAYPLTMVIYAMVPTSGLSHAKAAAIARFLDFAAGPGQTPGVQPGQLPAGYLPLPASMRAQTRKLAREVAAQSGNHHGGGGGGGGGNNGGGSNSSSGKSGSSANSGSGASASASQPPPNSGPQITLAAAHPQPAAFTRYVLPALLILGGLSALAGSSALLGTSEGGFRGRLRALGAGTATLGRSAWTRVRPNRTAAK